MTKKSVDYKESIDHEHQAAELLRIRKGMDGCGCPACQKLYRKIDLSVFGERVKRYTGVVTVMAGLTGADLYKNEDDEVKEIISNQDIIQNGMTRTTINEKAVTAPTPEEYFSEKDVTDDVTRKIIEMASPGMSSRKISEELSKEGVFVSYRTVARKLQGVLF